jgi:hypothetical protein
MISPSSWLRVLRRLSRTARPSSPRRKRRPALEVLENRLVPAQITLTVNTLADPTDPGKVTLRNALTQADSDTGNSHIIQFAPGLFGPGASTITLNTALPDLTGNLTITGPGANHLVVARNTAPATPDFSDFSVDPGATVVIQGLTLCTGNAVNGGGINNQGLLTLKDAWVFSNSASGKGAGIFSTVPATPGSVGGLTIVNSAITANTTTGDGGAAGIDIESGSLDLVNSTVANNTSAAGNNAGGIAVHGGSVQITDSTIAGNHATGTAQAGGLAVAAGLTADLLDTLLAGNLGGPDAQGPLLDMQTTGGAIGHNLIGVGSVTDPNGITNNQNGDQVGTTASPVDAQLGSLGDHGGPTPTQDLLGTSPAINAGVNPDPSLPLAPTADQRGFARVAQGTVDIGALETSSTLIASQTTVALLGGSSMSVLANQAVSFTATVSQVVIGSTTTVPAGSIHFTVDGGSPADVTLTSGVAELDLPGGLANGPHTIAATYNPSDTFSSSSDALTVSALLATQTTVAVFGSASTTVHSNQAIAFTATIVSVGGGANPPTPTGSVHFTVDGGSPSDVTVSNGVAQLNLPNGLATGSHTIAATYTPTGAFQGSSNSLNVTANPSGTGSVVTSTTLVASPTSLAAGQAVTLMAQVAFTDAGTTHGAVGGSVTFLDGGASLGSLAISGAAGLATLTTTLSPGTHSITAVYSGTPTLAPSTSSAATVSVSVPPAPPPPLQGDVTNRVQVSLGAPPKTKGKPKGFRETLTLSNTSGQALQGPLSVVLRGLSSRFKVKGTAGHVGTKKKKSPFVVIGGGLAVSGHTSITLQFNAKPNKFAVSVFAGTGPH